MGKRSNMLVAVGLVVFLLGGAIVMLVLKGEDDDDEAVAAGTIGNSRLLVVATEDLPAGTSGSEIVGNGKVKTEESSGASAAPDAVASPGELVGKVLALPVKKGEVVRLSGLRAETIKIPDGKQAVAVQVDFIPGVAGQVGPGDLVNLYATVTTGGPSFTKLLVANIEVLKVSEAPPPAASTPTTLSPLASPVAASGTPLVFLVAVDQSQAEKLVFAAKTQTLYAALAPKGLAPAQTPGRALENLFEG